MPVITLQTNVEQTAYETPTQWRMLGAQGKCEHVIKLCKENNIAPKRILEVGAGDGAILRYLSEFNFCEEMHALEISESGVEVILGQKIPRLMSCQTFDGYGLPFENDYFDLTILSHVLEHVEFERALLRELKRVSKFQIIEIPMDCNALTNDNYYFLGPSYGHINAHTTDSLRFLLHTEGFSVLDDLLGQYSLGLLEYDYFVNNNHERTEESVKRFQSHYQEQQADFEALPRVAQEGRASYYTVLTRKELPEERLERALKAVELSISTGQIQAGRLIFDHYVPPVLTVQSALRVAEVFSGTKPQVALEFIDKALAIQESDMAVLALKKTILQKLSNKSLTKEVIAQPQSYSIWFDFKKFVKNKFPIISRFARTFRSAR